MRPLPAALLAVALIATGCNKEESAEGGPPGGGFPPPAVVAVAAVSKDVPVYLDAIGKVAASESVTVMPRVDGLVVEQKFADGADVKKGDVLFVLDALPAQAAEASAEASVTQAQAAVNLANVELQRYDAVAGSRAISQSDYDTRRSAVEVAQAQLAAAQAQLRTAQLNLGYTTISSPLDGRAGEAMVDVGNVVRENETALLSLQQLDPVYADFTINERQLADVRANLATGTLVAHVKLPADADAGRQGELTFLDNAVQDGTGTVRLRVTLKNDDRKFWPGSLVHVRLVLKTISGAVLVPNAAPQLSQAGPYVLVVKADNTAEMRPVVQGQAQGDWVVIEQGVAAGEKVITDGQLMVRPGGPVSPLDSAASQPTAATSQPMQGAGVGQESPNSANPAPQTTGSQADLTAATQPGQDAQIGTPVDPNRAVTEGAPNTNTGSQRP